MLTFTAPLALLACRAGPNMSKSPIFTLFSLRSTPFHDMRESGARFCELLGSYCVVEGRQALDGVVGVLAHVPRRWLISHLGRELPESTNQSRIRNPAKPQS